MGTALDYLYSKVLSAEGLSANFSGENVPKKTQTNMKYFEFRYGIKNDTDQAVVYTINPGTFPTGNNTPVVNEQLLAIKKEHPFIDAIASDGDIFTKTDENNVSTKCTISVFGNKTFEHFKSFAKSHIFTIEDIELSSSEKNNLQASISVVQTNPFESQIPREVRLAKWFSLAQQDQTRVIAKGIDVPVGPDVMNIFTIEPHSEISIVFTIKMD